jgi:Fe-S cluster biogenesis protein NfuA
VIQPLASPRFTPRAQAAVRSFATAWVDGGHGSNPGLRIQATEEAPGSPPSLHLQLVDGASPHGAEAPLAGAMPVEGGGTLPLRFDPATGHRLAGCIIDFEDDEREGGVRGFLVRTAGPSGSREPGPPSPVAPTAPSSGASCEPVAGASPTVGPPAPSAPPSALVQLAGPGAGRRGHSGCTPSPPRPRSLSGAPSAASGSGSSHPLAPLLEEALRDRVNPLVESHGGVVLLEGVSAEGVARVSMAGGCQGCTAASATLNDVVRRILLRAVPGLQDVEDVTAHDEGANPWFAASGR